MKASLQIVRLIVFVLLSVQFITIDPASLGHLGREESGQHADENGWCLN